MITISGYTIRAVVNVDDFRNPFKLAASGDTPEIPAGVDLRFEFLFVKGSKVSDALIVDTTTSDFASMTLNVLAESRTGSAFMSATVASFDNTVTAANWNDKSRQHAVVTFTAAETELPATVNGTTYYLVLQALSGTGKILFEAWTKLKVILDGVPTDSVVVQPGNLIPSGAVYDGSGHYSLTVTAGVYYKWTDGGSHDTSLTNISSGDVAVSDSNFIANSTTVILNGTAGATVTAVVRKSPYLTADEVYALMTSVTGGSGQQTFGGTALPEGNVTAPRWSIYQQVDGSGVVLRNWVRTVGSGNINTGWN